MIISHEHKFIFIKTKKVAGTSVEITLSEICGPEDVITPIFEEELRADQRFRGPQNYTMPMRSMSIHQAIGAAMRKKRPLRFRNHMPATEIRKAVGDEIWNGYTTISIIRNPFDRIVSRFWHGNSSMGFRAFLLERPEYLLENRRIAWIHGSAAVDVMLRYENLAHDLSELSKRLRLPSDVGAKIADVHAKRGIRPIEASTDAMFADFPEGVDLVSILCRPEIEAFGYSAPKAIASTAQA